MRQTAISQARVAALCGSVAAAAGVSRAAWVSSIAPRVFAGQIGQAGERNLGRVPIVELWIGSHASEWASLDGDASALPLAVRVSVGKIRHPDAEARCAAILIALMASLRLQSLYTQSSYTADTLIEGPLGWQLDAVVIAEGYTCRETAGG